MEDHQVKSAVTLLEIAAAIKETTAAHCKCDLTIQDVLCAMQIEALDRLRIAINTGTMAQSTSTLFSGAFQELAKRTVSNIDEEE